MLQHENKLTFIQNKYLVLMCVLLCRLFLLLLLLQVHISAADCLPTTITAISPSPVFVSDAVVVLLARVVILLLLNLLVVVTLLLFQ